MSRNPAIRACIALALVLIAAAIPAASGAAQDTEISPIAPGCRVLGDGDRPNITGPGEADPADVPLNGKLIATAEVAPDKPIESGTSFTCTLTLRNRRRQPATLVFEAQGIRGSRARGTGIQYVTADDDAFESTAGPWLSVLQDGPVTIPPRGVLDLSVVVDVPADAPAGGRYAAILVSPAEPVQVEGDTAVGIETSIAIPFRLDVDGTGTSKLRLRDVEAPRVRWNREAWTLHGSLDNDGTTDATPRGRVRVRSIFGNTVRELPLATTAILPGGRTDLDVRWNGVPWIGIYRYDARVANAEAGSRDPVARASGWFVALPPAWVLALVALLVGVASWRLRRRPVDDVSGDDDEDDHVVSDD